MRDRIRLYANIERATASKSADEYARHARTAAGRVHRREVQSLPPTTRASAPTTRHVGRGGRQGRGGASGDRSGVELLLDFQNTLDLYSARRAAQAMERYDIF